MIDTISFRNFKALRDVTMPLTRFTVLVGPNGSGKTSVLQGIAHLHAGDPGSLLQGRLHPSLLRSQGSAGALELRSSGTWDGKQGTLRVLSYEVDAEQWEDSLDVTCDGVSMKHVNPADPRVQELLSIVRPRADFLRLDAANVAEPAYSRELVPRVASSGAGVAAVLAEMLVARADDFRRVEQALSAVVPHVSGMRLERAPVRVVEEEQVTIGGKTTTYSREREYVGHQVVFNMRGAPSLPAHLASEGTLIALGILTTIMGSSGRSSGPHVILIDDIERAVHPRALSALVAELRKLLDVCPGLQIIATSHSPYLVDHVAPSDVRLMIADDAGSACWARLDAHPDYQRWREVMRPGEIWSMVGEEWVRDGAAGSHD